LNYDLAPVAPQIPKGAPCGTCFFDDSDSFGSRGFVCLSGYVSDDPGWESFHKEWEALLRRHHLKRLHTSDFLAGHGEYEEIRETTPYQNRVGIVREFIAVIQKHIIVE